MKKWYQWFYLSLIFAAGGIWNSLEGRQIIAAVAQVGITASLGVVQFFCDRNGEKGRKIFRCISIVVCVLLVLSMLCLLIDAFA